MGKERERKMLNGWLACDTQREIAEAVGVDHKTVGKFIESLGKNGNFDKIPQTLGVKIDPDFTTYKRDLCDVWRKPMKNRAVGSNIAARAYLPHGWTSSHGFITLLESFYLHLL